MNIAELLKIRVIDLSECIKVVRDQDERFDLEGFRRKARSRDRVRIH
jgi:hypothetical protein